MHNEEVQPSSLNQQDRSRQEKSIWRKNADRWPSALVARTEIGAFTGGALNPKHMANLDSLGLGPESIRCGGRVVYPFESLIPWLEARTEKIKHRRTGGRNG